MINGLRYPRWGGREPTWASGENSKPEKGLESRQNPQRRVHALLGGVDGKQNQIIKDNTIFNCVGTAQCF